MPSLLGHRCRDSDKHDGVYLRLGVTRRLTCSGPGPPCCGPRARLLPLSPPGEPAAVADSDSKASARPCAAAGRTVTALPQAARLSDGDRPVTVTVTGNFRLTSIQVARLQIEGASDRDSESVIQSRSDSESP